MIYNRKYTHNQYITPYTLKTNSYTMVLLPNYKIKRKLTVLNKVLLDLLDVCVVTNKYKANKNNFKKYL